MVYTNRLIGCINYMITTYCDRNCPDCCCDIPNKVGRDVSWDYIVDSANYFRGIRRINLSGGEPTLHPQFVEFVPKLKELFQCRLLTIETNGWGFRKFPDAFRHFDSIQISHYTAQSYEGSWDNSEDVEYIINYLADTSVEILIGKIVHVDRERRSHGYICERGRSETVSYEHGLLYPCCAGPGVHGGTGIPLTSNWMQEIKQIDMPCHNCWFAE